MFQEHWPCTPARAAVPLELPPLGEEPDSFAAHQQGAAQEGNTCVCTKYDDACIFRKSARVHTRVRRDGFSWPAISTMVGVPNAGEDAFGKVLP